MRLLSSIDIILLSCTTIMLSSSSTSTPFTFDFLAKPDLIKLFVLSVVENGAPFFCKKFPESPTAVGECLLTIYGLLLLSKDNSLPKLFVASTLYSTVPELVDTILPFSPIVSADTLDVVVLLLFVLVLYVKYFFLSIGLNSTCIFSSPTSKSSITASPAVVFLRFSILLIKLLFALYTYMTLLSPST